MKNAFSPSPGARATGRFATKAITRVAIAAERAVAVNTLPQAIPEAERISGFTARMYAIARNVVTPATISLPTVVPRALSLNNFSIIDLLICPAFTTRH